MVFTFTLKVDVDDEYREYEDELIEALKERINDIDAELYIMDNEDEEICVQVNYRDPVLTDVGVDSA